MKPNRELTAIESALAQQVAALTNRVAELEAALKVVVCTAERFAIEHNTTESECIKQARAALKGAGK